MAVTVDQIDYWRSLPAETEVLEFKAATNTFSGDKTLEYCVAIGNEGGGHLLLGIRNETPRIIVGTKAVDNPNGMAEKIFNKLGFRVHVEEIQHPDGRVVVYSIPSRPKGSAFHLDGKYLMRVGESLQPMSPDQLRKIFSEDPTDWLEDSIVRVSGPERVRELLDIGTFFDRIAIPEPELSLAIDRLVAERLIDREQGGEFSIRRMAALLLARDLRNFPDLARKAPRVIVFKGSSKSSDPTERQDGGFGYAIGFPSLIRFVNARLPQKEIIDDTGLRRTVALIPSIMVRELIANALVHQDFLISGTSVLIEIFDNRLEVSSPGDPIIPIDRLVNEVRSRNERFAEFMRRMGVCEERGSGIDKVIDAAESQHLPSPDFRLMHDRTVCVAYGPRDFSNTDRTERIRACYQHCCLKWETSSVMTNQSLRERFKLPVAKTHLVSQVISKTLAAGLIKADERGGASKKFARYVPYFVDSNADSVTV
jgi:ATP-dependent DNA helicase RecG